MKKNITVIFTLFFIQLGSLYSQIQVSNDTIRVEGFNAADEGGFVDIYTQYIFKNNNAASDSFRWVRTVNIFPTTGWESAVCDINLCYGSDVDSADFVMSAGDSGVFYSHFYPGNAAGTAEMVVEIFNLTDRTQKATTVSYATAWDAYSNVATTTLENNLVYPNPTNEGYIYIKASEGIATIKNIEGKILLSQQLEQSNTRIDVRTLAKGIYFIEIKDNQKTKIQKIIIN